MQNLKDILENFVLKRIKNLNFRGKNLDFDLNLSIFRAKIKFFDFNGGNKECFKKIQKDKGTKYAEN